MNLSHSGNSLPPELSQASIRVAKRADEEAIVQVIARVYEEYGFPWDAEGYNADLYDLDANYFNHGDIFWVAELYGQVVGTAALEFFPTIEGEGDELIQIEDLKRIAGCDCALHRLYLSEKARGQGLGKRLTLHAIEEAKSQGKTKMEIWTDKRLTTAHKLYQGLGGHIIGERLCNDPEQAPEWGIVLNL